MARNNNSKFAVKPKNVDPKYDLWADNKPVLPRDFHKDGPAPTAPTDTAIHHRVMMVKGKLEAKITWLKAPGKVMRVDKNGCPILGIKFIDRRTDARPYKSVLDIFNGLERKLELKKNKQLHAMAGSCRVYAIDENSGEEFDIAVFTAEQPYHFVSKED
jgi:hypothetical protein